MNTAQSIKEKGYALLPQLVSARSTYDFRNEICSSGAGSYLYFSDRDLLLTAQEIILPIIAAPEVLSTAESIMGPFVQLDSISLACLPKHSKCEISWHRDPYGNFPRGTEFQRPLALNLLVYLQDLDNDVGPLRVIPGSHRSPLKISITERNQPHPLEELIFAKAGDGVLIHNNLIHSRSQNKSHTDRAHISIIYNLSCMKSMLNTSSPHVKEIIEQLEKIGDPRLLRLFGFDNHSVTRYNAGFLIEDEEQWQQWRDSERGEYI